MYPINLGISTIDSKGNLIDQDYLHLGIKYGGVFKKGERVSVPIFIGESYALFEEGNWLRFELVQEGVSWIDSSAVLFYQ